MIKDLKIESNFPLIIWMLLIGVLSLIPLGSGGPDLIPNQDKILHFISYALLAWLMYHCFSAGSMRYPMIVALIMSILYGLLIEVLQGIVNTGRCFDYFDIIANIIGSLAGSFMYYFTRTK